MATYYCRFLPDFSRIKQPITALKRNGVAFIWGPEQHHAFEDIKQLLTSARVLRTPEWSKTFNLHTDWSKEGVGAKLSPIGDDGVEYAVAYASHTNTQAEIASFSYEGEVSAV